MDVRIKFGGEHLNELLSANDGRPPSIYKLSKESGIHYHTIKGFFSGVGRQINLDIVEKFLKYCRENDYNITLSDMFTVEHID